MHAPECPRFEFAADDPIASRMGFGAAALRYLKLGYAVLPLERGGKKPHRMLSLNLELGKQAGVYQATTYPSQVWEWWKQDPAANIGIACGQRSKLVVVDLDVKGGSPGPHNFGTFVTGKGWPECPYVRTPSGGVHLWVRTAELMPERPGILPGVDIKAEGGLVVAPPSRKLQHVGSQPGDAPGGGIVTLPYEWDGCPCQVPPAPGWLAEWLRTAVSTGNSQSEQEIIDFAVSELLENGIETGSRNVIMYRAACSLYRKACYPQAQEVKPDTGWVNGGKATTPALAEGMTYERLQDVLEKLGKIYAAIPDKSGFTWNEVLTIADSARRFIEKEYETDKIRNQSAGFIQ